MDRRQSAGPAPAGYSLPAGLTEGMKVVVQIDEGGVGVVERLAQEWRELCEEEASNDPCGRPEWVAAYVSAFEPQGTVLVIAARVDGRLRAILPLLRKRARLKSLPFRKLTTSTTLGVTRFDLVRSSGAEGDAATAALWDALKGMAGWDMLELGSAIVRSPLEHLAIKAREDGWLATCRATQSFPYIPIPAWDPNVTFPIEPDNKRKRRELRKVMRDLGPYPGRLKLLSVETADQEAIERFCGLESAGWKGKEKSAINSVPAIKRYYTELIKNAAQFGYLKMYELYLDNRYIAGHIGVEYHDKYLSPKVAYDEHYDHYSPGHLILLLILQNCARRGLVEYDSLGDVAEWKSKWTSNVRERRTWRILRPTLYGRLLFAAALWKGSVRKQS